MAKTSQKIDLGVVFEGFCSPTEGLTKVGLANRSFSEGWRHPCRGGQSRAIRYTPRAPHSLSQLRGAAPIPCREVNRSNCIYLNRKQANKDFGKCFGLF